MPALSWHPGAITTANTAKDGTGTVYRIFTASPKGSFVHKVVFRALGTNVATVARVFANNGQTHADATNNVLVGEKTLAATTLDEAAAFADQELAINLDLPPDYRLHVVLGTTVAAGYHVSARGQDHGASGVYSQAYVAGSL